MLKRMIKAFLLISMIATTVLADTPYAAYITKKTNCYADANSKSTKIASLSINQDVTVLEETVQGKTSWAKVQFESEDGRQEGYVVSESVTPYTPIAVYDATLSGGLFSQFISAQPVGYSASAVPVNGTARVVFEGIGSYTGEFSDRKRSGNGTFTWDNGDQYTGFWEDDEITGEGILSFANGISCEGSFKAGKLQEGIVSYSQSDGRLLTRNVMKGKFLQESTLYCLDGTYITGKISSGKMSFSGKVFIQYASGDTYEGTLKDGLKSGTGTYMWVDGSHYTGNWISDMMHGKGTYYFQADEKGDYITGSFTENLPGESINVIKINA